MLLQYKQVEVFIYNADLPQMKKTLSHQLLLHVEGVTDHPASAVTLMLNSQ